MAFKGVVDTEAYVIDGYQAPVDYFNPAESVSDYILPQNYFTFSEPYVFASLTLFPAFTLDATCLLYTSPSPRDVSSSRMPSSA